MEKKRLILFLADGSNNLELMATGFARRIKDHNARIISATMTPPGIHPIAKAVMAEADIDIAEFSQRTLMDIEPFTFELTITLGDFDPSCRPNLPGMPPNFHWDAPDPSPDTPGAQARKELVEARDIIEQNVQTLFASRLLDALFVTRRNLEIILDNLLDGVLAHTRRRRIFFFNYAAERITGYKRSDIIGKDCHEVFPGRFCGGECEFCEGQLELPGKSPAKREVTFTRKDGEERLLLMSSMPLTDETGQGVGAVIAFKDETELSLLKTRVKHHHTLGGLVGMDPSTLEVFRLIREVAAVGVPVLIQGDTGTGKELVANAIHDLGSRADKPFVAVNCGALPEGVLESELFGHVRGAFTGAVANKKGRFELAHQGSIFLDEIGELSQAMQVKLLRVLQEQRFEPVGGEKSIQVDVRIISATNQDLRRLMEKRKFRRDLFYRLCVFPIMVPPLKDRRLDIPTLVEHFIDLVAAELDREILAPSVEILDILTSYPWPGNVRELHNAIEFAYVKCRGGVIHPRHLPPEILSYEAQPPKRPGPQLKLSKEEILMAISRAGGNKKKAANLLKIGRATLYRYLNLFGLK